MENSGFFICEEVAQVEALHASILNDGFYQLPIKEQLSRLAENLYKAHQDANPACTIQIKNWFPDLIGKPNQHILDTEFSLGNAQLTIAREFGFQNWEKVEQLKDTACNENFEHAVDAVIHGDIEQLKQMLDKVPTLATMRSCYGHQATLLIYLAANGVETYRQKTPYNAVEIAKVLLDAGADKNAKAKVYDGEHDALALLTSSSHPYEAGVGKELEAILLNE
jgi:hypothetical protein